MRSNKAYKDRRVKYNMCGRVMSQREHTPQRKQEARERKREKIIIFWCVNLDIDSLLLYHNRAPNLLTFLQK